MADSRNVGNNISEETSIDEMAACHRLEVKQLHNKEVEMKKEATKGSKAEQTPKRKQVDEDIYSKHIDGECTECTEERHARKKPKLKSLEIDPEREETLKEQMEISIKKMESSEFYKSFLQRLKSPEVSSHFDLMLGSETQLQMVIYGIGSIDSEENPRFQLSIAILMKREFDWIGNNIEVFDPVLSATEASVITSLGCTVLSVNEEARREALKPTLFFMPHCPAHLYNNLLESNWRMDRLSKIALLGNSFKMYKDMRVTSDDQYWIQAAKRLKVAHRVATEFAIKTVSEDVCEYAFNGLSLHFFKTGVECELPSTI